MDSKVISFSDEASRGVLLKLFTFLKPVLSLSTSGKQSLPAKRDLLHRILNLFPLQILQNTRKIPHSPVPFSTGTASSAKETNRFAAQRFPPSRRNLSFPPSESCDYLQLTKEHSLSQTLQALYLCVFSVLSNQNGRAQFIQCCTVPMRDTFFCGVLVSYMNVFPTRPFENLFSRVEDKTEDSDSCVEHTCLCRR